MGRLIDAIQLKIAIAYSNILEDGKTLDQIIDEQPTIEPERKRGKWIYGEDYIGRDGWICDKCGHFIAWDYSVDLKSAEKDLPNFCPNCGADMRSEE